jgi:hypothetical protein
MREYHSEQEWKVWIDDLDASGLSVKDWAEEHGVRAQTVSKWRGRIKKRYQNDTENSFGPWIKMDATSPTVSLLPGQDVAARCLGPQNASSCFCVTVKDVQIAVPASYADEQLIRLIGIARTS